jgi:hypothetical protein
MARSRSSRLVRVLGVANAAGNLEVADLALVDAGDVPEVVLAPGGDSREALEVGSLVPHDVGALAVAWSIRSAGRQQVRELERGQHAANPEEVTGHADRRH